MQFLSAVPVIGNLIDSLSKGIDELITSDEERGKIELEKKKMALKKIAVELKTRHEQLKINLVQANHPSIFVAGARPAIIWIGALGLAYEAILRPILSWISVRLVDVQAVMGAEAFSQATTEQIEAVLRLYAPPSINEQMFMPIVLGILGIGGMRSFEKIKGKARENLKAGSGEFKQLAETMLTRLKARQEALEPASSGNAAIDQYRKASADPGYKPYYPDPEKLL